MNNYDREYEMYWQRVVGDKILKLDLKKLQKSAIMAFESDDISNNYKQKLVYNLLDTVKNNDQNRFFYTLLKTINKPDKENFGELWNQLQQNYDVMPEDAFINFAYAIILGIMKTYGGKEK